MKKIISLVLVLVMAVAFAAPAMAADVAPTAVFTGSPTEGDAHPIIIVKVDGEEDNEVDKFVLSTLHDAQEGTTEIPQEARDLLIEVYDKMAEGELELPLDDTYVVRDLVDVSYRERYASEAEELKEEGTTVTITFKLGVGEDAEVAVYSFVGGEWIEAVKVTNNGDGSVTVEFEDICPVAFAVKE